MHRSIIIATLLLISCVAFTPVAQAVTTLTASSSTATYTENDDMYIDPGLTITGSESTYSSAKVYIGDGYVSGQDYLRYDTTSGISGSFDTSTGVLTLSSDSTTPAAYQAAFRNVRYENTNEEPNTANRKITFVLGGNTLYLEDTGHYYEYVASSHISWTAAETAAASRELEGLQGYLATITSAAENTFISSKIQGQAWIGASDADTEGVWKWVTGPEAGTQFWSGNYAGSALAYENWASGEPNDAYLSYGEDCAHLLVNGEWNDYYSGYTDPITGYFVEYGGMAGDESPQLSTTVTVSVTSVNDAPTTPGAFTSPTSGQIKQGGSSMTVSWGSSTDVEGDSVKYDLWLFNGSWAQIGSLLTSTSMAYTLPQDDTENAMFRVYANDTQDNSSARDVTFTIDSSGPDHNWVEKVLNGSTGETVTVEINVTDIAGVDWCNITVDGQEYEMTFDSGNYSYNISIPASNSGTLVSSMTYNCSFADNFGHVNNTENVHMNVSILPIADINVNVSRGISPLTVNFTDNSSGLVTDWNWDFGDGSNTTDSNTTHMFTSGNYTVNLTVQNSNGTSSSLFNIRCADEPINTYSPENTSAISAYGEELNFSIQSTLYSSFVWLVDGNPVNGTGATLFNNTNDSSLVSYCLINSSQYFSQSNFFMEIYNVSVQTSNESIGRTDTHSWEWTITNSSESGDDIEIMINTTPDITINGSDKYLRFNTTNNNERDCNGLACSIISTSFNTGNNTTGIQIKVEVLNTSSINSSSIDFPASSIYQYFDIGFNNETLVNDGSNNRSIEFRVLNTKDGGSLIINTVYLRHWSNPQWEAYTPELTGNDGTYSYFIVRNISGYSPFAVTCNYQYSSSSTSESDGMPYYLKKLLFWSDDETVEETAAEMVSSEDTDIVEPVSTGISDGNGISASMEDPDGSDLGHDGSHGEESSTLKVLGLLALLIVAGFFIILIKRRNNEENERL
ncbi:PKD domain-containing protein [Methanolobus profundi]|uniref:PKD repeat-containing protein n=1 Tax=Methanolobus profundi TaxID=487685 RepID=A0A1I4USQ9_9EURY|nr:PKD domain-containing protein [Methanolobus profundi]SFM91783.1 PKD repeat-containing protein [Methanolobus profundi]